MATRHYKEMQAEYRKKCMAEKEMAAEVESAMQVFQKPSAKGLSTVVATFPKFCEALRSQTTSRLSTSLLRSLQDYTAKILEQEAVDVEELSHLVKVLEKAQALLGHQLGKAECETLVTSATAFLKGNQNKQHVAAFKTLGGGAEGSMLDVAKFEEQLSACSPHLDTFPWAMEDFRDQAEDVFDTTMMHVASLCELDANKPRTPKEMQTASNLFGIGNKLCTFLDAVNEVPVERSSKRELLSNKLNILLQLGVALSNAAALECGTSGLRSEADEMMELLNCSKRFEDTNFDANLMLQDAVSTLQTGTIAFATAVATESLEKQTSSLTALLTTLRKAMEKLGKWTQGLSENAPLPDVLTKAKATILQRSTAEHITSSYKHVMKVSLVCMRVCMCVWGRWQ